jgi:5-methylcytosine-specific restriction endonuclease McrA
LHRSQHWMAYSQKMMNRVEIKEKVCSKCKLPKDRSMFYKDKNNWDGLRSQCKECSKSYKKEHKELYKEKISEYRKSYYELNKFRVATQQKEYRLVNREKIASYQKEYLAQNKERLSAYIGNYYIINKEKMKESMREWRRNNHAVVQGLHQKRRALKRGAEICDLTRKEWEIIKASFGYKCAYCGIKTNKLTQDHITPLSKGGNHTAQNIVPVCHSCNAKKGARGPLAPVQPLLIAS